MDEYRRAMMLDLTSEQKLLIVDDCQVFTTLTREMLVRLGLSPAQIDSASNSSECIELCATQNYHAILLDHNLNDETDGQQLLSQLRRQQLISSQCVVVIVTANNSLRVVRSFLELEPDGYLVKPLSYELIKRRLPSIINKKLALAKSYQLLETGEYESVIECVDDVRDNAQELVSQCLILQAQALYSLGRYTDARNILISIPEGNDSPKVALALAEIYRVKNQFALAVDVLTKYLEHPIYSAAIHEKIAEIYFEQKSMPEAVEAITYSVQLSPENCSRQLKFGYIAIASFDIKLAISAVDSSLRYMSQQDERYLPTLQKLTQLLVDYAYFEGEHVHKFVSQKITESCTQWRNLFTKSEYKPFELILLARFNATLGFHSRAEQQYQDALVFNIENDEDIYNQLEFLKLCYMLNKLDKYQAVLQTTITQIAHLPASLENKALETYLAKWRYNIDQNITTSRKLYDEAKKELRLANHHAAFPKLISALRKNRGNLEIAHLIIQTLTLAWPSGWNKHQVRHLALMCVELLKHSHFSNQTAFKRACRKISQRIDTELLPTDFVTAA